MVAVRPDLTWAAGGRGLPRSTGSRVVVDCGLMDIWGMGGVPPSPTLTEAIRTRRAVSVLAVVE
jgi:hypothetical protein